MGAEIYALKSPPSTIRKHGTPAKLPVSEKTVSRDLAKWVNQEFSLQVND